jgi:hypothetical protein
MPKQRRIWGSSQRNLGWIVCGLLLGILCVLVASDFGEPHPATVDPSKQSSNLDRDLALMWETKRRDTDQVSTYRAINAASRVFNSVTLEGKSVDEVVSILGDPRSSSKSVYNFPFYPPPEDCLVYRFDDGAGGWQFNVIFNSDRIVTGIERLAIE